MATWTGSWHDGRAGDGNRERAASVGALPAGPSTKLIGVVRLGLLVALLFASAVADVAAAPCPASAPDRTEILDPRDRRPASIVASRLSASRGRFAALASTLGLPASDGPVDEVSVRLAPHAGEHAPDQHGRSGEPTDFDASSVLEGDFRIFSSPSHAVDGSRAMARINGGGNAYARGQWTVAWDQGTVFRAEMSVFLPVGFYASQQGAVQLMGWDTFPTLNNHMRLAIWQSDHQARLFLKSDGKDTTLTNAFAIPEGRWVRIAVEQKIDDASGWSRVYRDGQLVAHGSGRTSTAHPVTRMRYGLVAIDAATQTLPLSIWLREVTLASIPADVVVAAQAGERCADAADELQRR
jgi:hypothetical protein